MDFAEPHASMQARCPRGATVPAPVLDRLAIRAALHGPLVDVLIEQHYRNDAGQDIEAVYTFPLPAGAVLAGLEFELRGVRYAGTVRARQEAARNYEQAITQGDTPVLVERGAHGLYTAQLGNLKAGERAAVRLRYAQCVEADGDAWRIAIPTVLAPLYGDPEKDGGLAPHQAPRNSLLADIPLAFEFLARDLRDMAAVACSSHAVDTSVTPEGVRLVARPGARLDRDIVVRALRAPALIAITTPDLPQAGKDPHVALAACRIPAEVPTGSRVRAPGGAPLSLRVVLDCSGSMAGDSMNWASVACQRLVRGLLAGDEFSITRFGSRHEHWKDRLVAAEPRNIAAAVDWLYGVKADLGGTEMQAALRAAAGLRGAQRNSDILLITDGQIMASDALVREARGAGRRVFVIGVGAAPRDAFLRDLAEATEGRCQIVTPGESLPAAVDPVLQRLRLPTVEAIAVRWPAPTSWTMQWPQRPLPGETVFLYAGFESACEGPVEVEIGLGKDTSRIAAPVRTAYLGGGPLRSVVASERIRSGHFVDPVAAAVDYQLVTEWTSLVAVAQRAAGDKAGSMPLLARVEQMIPAGWGGTGALAGVASGPIASDDFQFLRAGAPRAMVDRLGPASSADPSARGKGQNFIARRPAARADRAGAAVDADAAQYLAPPRVQVIARYREEFLRGFQRLERRRFAQGVFLKRRVTGLALLRWAGMPESLLQELAAAGAERVDGQELVDRFVTLCQPVLCFAEPLHEVTAGADPIEALLVQAMTAFFAREASVQPGGAAVET